MISKKNALTSVLLLSTVLLNGCDWLDSEPYNTTAETTLKIVKNAPSIETQPIVKRTAAPAEKLPLVAEKPVDSLLTLNNVMNLNLSEENESNLFKTLLGYPLDNLDKVQKELADITDISKQYSDARRLYINNPESKNLEDNFRQVNLTYAKRSNAYTALQKVIEIKKQQLITETTRKTVENAPSNQTQPIAETALETVKMPLLTKHN
ncbi:hypothetical protein [Candidatus Liberibacter sp.]|uniref:hypothetical protein n=1 Tax=Candidatus Liberibacter sp. TaxID=34022 RepID=UPI0015F74854|nr:hypothetical protein [Candidatus Liberibacter sp.]MBA5724505.1 hypothetical protein [Candidatus Liberibacter sp.]